MHLLSAVKSPWPLDLLITSLICPLGFAGGGATQRSDGAFANFLVWVDAYGAADERARDEMEGEGKRLARERRMALGRLMEEEPAEALALILSEAELENLPSAVREQTERPLKGEGILRAMVLDDFSGRESRYDYSLAFEGRRYRAFLALGKTRVLINRPLCVEGFILGGRALLTNLEPMP